MSSENKKDIINLIKIFETKKDDLEDILKSEEYESKIIFEKIFKEIIFELNCLNSIITDKNPKNNFSKYDNKYLYELINLFTNLKFDEIPKEDIESIITKENLYIIMKIFIRANQYNILANNILEFNKNIINLLSSIIQENSELLLNDILFYQGNILPKFLKSLSRNRKGREFIYDIERNILMFIQDNDKYLFYIESMNSTIKSIYEQLSEKNVESIIEEIQEILYIYKSRIKVIGETMGKLLMKIFCINEKKLNEENAKEDNYNEIISNFLKYCFNRIIFTYSSNINLGNEISMSTKDKSQFQYNVDFMNLLLDVYQELINNKIKNGYTNFLMELFFDLDNIGNGAIRYKWLIRHTNYPKIVLESLIKLKDCNLLTLYLTKIVFLAMKNNKENYNPEYDISFFFSKLDEIFDINNLELSNKFFNIFGSQIINFININSEILEIIYKKCDIFNKSLIILNSKIYSNDIKYNILELLNNIINLNKDRTINYTFNFPINSQFELDENFDLNNKNSYGLRYKLYLLYFNSDINVKDFIDNNSKMIDNIKYYSENKKNYEMFIFIDLFFNSFLFNNNIIFINEFNQNQIDKINEIFFQVALDILNKEINDEKKTEIFIIKYLDLFLNFIYSYNIKIFELKKNKQFMKTKLLFNENALIKIYQIIFDKINNPTLKNKIITRIIFYNFNNNKNIEKIGENNIKIIQSAFFILIILKALNNLNDFISISYIYDELLKSINSSDINIKLILNSDIICFTMKLLINQYGNRNKDNEPSLIDFLEKTISLLKILLNFLNQSTLIKYLYNIFNIFYENIIDFDNNENNSNKYKKIILILFTILKDSLKSFYYNQKQNYQYLSISKKIFSNPYIYNIFYINNLQIEEPLIHFNMDIRLNSFQNIDKFNLVNFINGQTNQSLFITIDNKSQLLICENNDNNKNKMDILASYQNIDNYLLIDKKFHNISIIIDTENKSINILIDYKKINANKKIVHYKNFLFDSCGLYIGYDFDDINLFNKDYPNANTAIIDIANILLINYTNDTDNFFINKKKEGMKSQYEDDYILDYLYNQKMDRHKNILAEVCFNSTNIKIMKTKYLEKTNNFVDNYFIYNEEKINKYLSYIDIVNPLKNKSNSKLYMLSLNESIEEYFSSNNILSLQNLNNIFIQSIFSEESNIFSSSSNFTFIEFLLGFIYDIDKRNKLLENNNEITKEQKFILLNDEYIKEYILIIFQIIFDIKNKEISNYYISNGNALIKMKFFFKNNIYLLNERTFLNKFIEILIKNKNYFLIASIHIFTDLIIFTSLNKDSQNIILSNLLSILDEKKDEEEKNEIKIIQKFSSDIILKKEELNPLLFENLLIKLFDLILYYPLSIDENKENIEKQEIDKVLQLIKIILEKIKNSQKMKIINQIRIKIHNLFDKKEEHKIESFFEENKLFIKKENSIINNEIIKKQIESLNTILFEFVGNQNDEILDKNLIQSNDENKISDINNNNDNIKNLDDELNNYEILELNHILEEKIKDENKCSFCQYLNDYFKIHIDDFFAEIEYEKNKKYFYRYIFLNFKEYREKLGKNNYAWILSGKQSIHCFQNKYFLKENKIKSYPPKKKKLKKENLFSYKYNYDKKTFLKYSIQLQTLFTYDKICLDNHFINSFNINKDKASNNFIFENCLLINRNHRTISLFILCDEYILILPNIFIDKENNLQICLGKNEMNLWCINNEEYLNELDNYLQNNNSQFNNILNNDKNDTKDNSSEFGLSKNYQFSIKKIKISEISEMYKTSFLQIPNSIEIITNKGKNYFLCFNIDRRDNAFYTIIDNISNKYSNNSNLKNNKKITNILKKSYKANSNEILYMKYCPSYFCSSIGNKFHKITDLNQKIRINKNEFYNKGLIEKAILINELSQNWTKNKVSNYDYILILNILSERSLINLSQYMIFPLIICNFIKPVLNPLNKSIYRDLSLPIFVCYPSLINDFNSLNNKTVNLEEMGESYHSGVFYSTYAFVSYFLIRQHPYTEIHLEIQGGEFDNGDRLFIGKKELSTLEEKYQELIPALYTLPELYINTNNYLIGKFHKLINGEYVEEYVNDFILPKWAMNDQRKLILYFKKLFESKNISQNLHSWIDLIFGYKMQGLDAIKVYNTYRKACYEYTREEIESEYSEGILSSTLIEKLEMGYMAKQLFKKQHKKKEIVTEGFKEYEYKLVEKLTEINNFKFNKINLESNDDDKLIKINDIIIKSQNDYIKFSLNKKQYYHQGGISSLKSVMNALNNESNIQNYKNIDFSKLMVSFEKDTKFVFLGKKCLILGDYNNRIFLNYNKKLIRIIYNNFNVYSLYCLNEKGNISSIVANSKGTKLYIGFDNGNIIVYKIKLYLDAENIIKEPDCIYPFKNLITFNKNKNNNFTNNAKNNSNVKNKKNDMDEPPTLVFQKIISKNNFIFNNPHIPSKIRKLSLDEKNNILIALTNTNIIHLISLNNNFKLMNTINYFIHFNCNYKMKNIYTFADNGDFIIYSSLSVNLFSINGVPICELNLLKDEKNIIPKISYCVAAFTGDVILFTGHKDGSVIIWKMITLKSKENKDEFLQEYYYNYSFNFDLSNINRYLLRRKFEIIIKVEQNKDMKIPIKFMKLSHDMNYLLIIYENKNIFILNKTAEENNNNINEKKETDNTSSNNENKTKKIFCSICKKEFDDNHIIDNDIENFEIKDNEEEEKDNNFEIVNKHEVIDKIIEEKNKFDNDNICSNCITDLEDYLYNP